MRIHIPRPLVRDDARVAIVRPAGAVELAPLTRAAERLRAASGWQVDPPGDETPSRTPPVPPWLADSDDARAEELIRALTTADVVWAARGGYGCARILDRLPEHALRERPTWLCGFSDITALHLWAGAQGVASVHAANARGVSDGADEAAIASLVATLRLGRGTALPVRPACPGRAQGIVTGGNLTVLASLAGTRWLPTLKDRILLLEDVGEAPYRIDRALHSLLMDGRASGLRGVILGHFTRCGEGDIARERCVEMLRPLGIPVVQQAPIGHEAPNRAMLLHVPWEIDGSVGALHPVARTGITIQPVRTGVLTGLDRACDLVESAVRAGIGSGAQLVAASGETTILDASFGFTSATDIDHTLLAHGPVPVRSSTRFDLASLTKCLSTAVLAWQAIAQGRLSIDEPIPDAIAPGAARAGVTCLELLTHRSGLPAWRRLYPEARGRDDAEVWLREALGALPVDPDQRGRCVYSDPGYLLLGFWLERVFDAPLASLFQERIAARVPEADLRFLRADPRGVGDSDPRITASGPQAVPVRGGAPTTHAVYAATEYCPVRRRVLHGVVHDEHAQILGGSAGHAGLFGSARSVLALLDALRADDRLLPADLRERMWDPRGTVDGGSFTAGWDTPSGVHSSAGGLTRGATVGHLGFTGTSVWFDRRRDLRVVLLTNRVHPSRDDLRIRTLRPAVHDAILDALDA